MRGAFTIDDVDPVFFGPDVELTDEPVPQLLMHRFFTAAQRLWDETRTITPSSIASVEPTISERVATNLLHKRVIQDGLVSRGIGMRDPRGELTREQIAFLAIYFDMSTPSDHRARLRAAGVSQRALDSWRKQPRFAAEMERLSEDRLRSVQPLAFERMAEAVDRGERWAIEMTLEVTGRHDRRQQSVDVNKVMMQVFGRLEERLSALGPDGVQLMQEIAGDMRAIMAGPQVITVASASTPETQELRAWPTP